MKPAVVDAYRCVWVDRLGGLLAEDVSLIARRIPADDVEVGRFVEALGPGTVLTCHGRRDWWGVAVGPVESEMFTPDRTARAYGARKWECMARRFLVRCEHFRDEGACAALSRAICDGFPEDEGGPGRFDAAYRSCYSRIALPYLFASSGRIGIQQTDVIRPHHLRDWVWVSGLVAAAVVTSAREKLSFHRSFGGSK